MTLSLTLPLNSVLPLSQADFPQNNLLSDGDRLNGCVNHTSAL